MSYVLLVSEKAVVKFSFCPFPKKLFSLIPAPIVSPVVPNPAVTEISPVGLSSTLISISLNELFDPSLISVFTFLKIPRL